MAQIKVNLVWLKDIKSQIKGIKAQIKVNIALLKDIMASININ